MADIYDSWGNTLSVQDGNGQEITSENDIGNLNPFRYRGYYFDSETGLYYLQNRYYDPKTCRFVNADTTDILAAKGDLYDKPLFAYCDNNPVARVDYGGEFWEWAAIGATVGALIKRTVSAISRYAETGEIDWLVVGANAASGAISGLIGGRGANAKSLETTWKAASKGITRETRRANEKYAAKRMAQYRLEQAVIKRTIKITLGRMILSPIGSKIACKLIERIKR